MSVHDTEAVPVTESLAPARRPDDGFFGMG